MELHNIDDIKINVKMELQFVHIDERDEYSITDERIKFDTLFLKLLVKIFKG